SVKAKIPAWRVEVGPAAGSPGSRAVVDVSEQGGQVVWLLVLRSVGDPTIGVDQAREKAMQFLGARGYPPMEVTYHLQQGNTVTFNMAPVQNGVVLYPDLVKVTVALDNGQVVGLESTGYLFNHQARDLPAPRVTRTAALAKLSPRLQASGGRLALIPTEGGGEKLTYEFLARLGEDAFLIYVDALTGRQERILKLIPLPGGTLTM
ncbi:MAG: germination protein YpeB, partial [Firmicutes bacterium]|nr:germination protein YpeB [Bacillota bacterium]